MIKVAAALLAAVAFVAPAAATVTIQTKSVSLATLDDAALTDDVTFKNFNFYDLAGEHLQRVNIVITANIDGRVDATNNATGGTTLSRRRDVSATYVLVTSLSGNGLSALGTQSATQSRSGINGNGTVVTLNQLNPSLVAGDTLLTGFDPFLSGAVRFALQASALFLSAPASDVTYGTPSITGGRATIELSYISAIPEPATWGLMVGGFVMVGVARRSRRPAKVA